MTTSPVRPASSSNISLPPTASPIITPTIPSAIPSVISTATLTHPGIAQTLRDLHAFQNELDTVHDLADLKMLMRTALQSNGDSEITEFLQVGRDEMPEAIMTLQRALLTVGITGGGVEEMGGISGSVGSATTAAASASGAGCVGAEKVRRHSVDALPTGRARHEGEATTDNIKSAGTLSHGSTATKDALDREFMESGIDALRRLSPSIELPSWTIMKWVELCDSFFLSFCFVFSSFQFRMLIGFSL